MQTMEMNEKHIEQLVDHLRLTGRSGRRTKRGIVTDLALAIGKLQAVTDYPDHEAETKDQQNWAEFLAWLNVAERQTVHNVAQLLDNLQRRLFWAEVNAHSNEESLKELPELFVKWYDEDTNIGKSKTIKLAV